MMTPMSGNGKKLQIHGKL